MDDYWQKKCSDYEEIAYIVATGILPGPEDLDPAKVVQLLANLATSTAFLWCIGLTPQTRSQ